MKRSSPPDQGPVYLGIECGGTRTVALAVGTHTVRREFSPENLRLLGDPALQRHFSAIAHAMPKPTAICIGMAGARTEADRERIRRTAAKAWPDVPCHPTSDLETALMSAEPPGLSSVSGDKSRQIDRVLALSGTGSCCFGRTHDGRTVKVGGWGHILGDKGSGFEIGLRALKAVVYYLDRDGEWSALGRRLLRKLQLNEPDDLIDWVKRATKDEIAALAVEVFSAWAHRDAIATDILAGAAGSLAKDAAACAGQLVRKGTPVQFVLAGSVLLKQPRFAAKVGRELRTLWPGAVITPLQCESVVGAVRLAQAFFPLSGEQKPVRLGVDSRAVDSSLPANLSALVKSPTEQRNRRSVNLDRMPISDAIALMLDEDRKIPAALFRERKKIEAGVSLIARSLRRRGRLFYVGAGTSGRLGVLDASECPPTFRTEPEIVQGIIAGGQHALWEAVEGAEDDAEAGARAVHFREVKNRDTVVGIAASGRTPFVWGALREAKRRGAATILLCFNPALSIPISDRPTVVIAPNVGPEVLTGSTRLKAGTATKLVLNIFTTLAMVRLGKVRSNLMIDVKASNAKLRDRAIRIARELSGADYETARAALERSRWNLRAACAQLSHARNVRGRA